MQQLASEGRLHFTTSCNAPPPPPPFFPSAVDSTADHHISGYQQRDAYELSVWLPGLHLFRHGLGVTQTSRRPAASETLEKCLCQLYLQSITSCSHCPPTPLPPPPFTSSTIVTLAKSSVGLQSIDYFFEGTAKALQTLWTGRGNIWICNTLQPLNTRPFKWEREREKKKHNRSSY